MFTIAALGIVCSVLFSPHQPLLRTWLSGPTSGSTTSSLKKKENSPFLVAAQVVLKKMATVARLAPIEFNNTEEFTLVPFDPSVHLDRELVELDPLESGVVVVGGGEPGVCTKKNLFQCLQEGENDGCMWVGGDDGCVAKPDRDREPSHFERTYALYHSLLAGTPEPVVSSRPDTEASGLVALTAVDEEDDYYYEEVKPRRKYQRRRAGSKRRKNGKTKRSRTRAGKKKAKKKPRKSRRR